MYFCIATVEYWHSVGFDTTDWRRSVDNTKAIVHERFAKVLIDTENNINIQRYLYPSSELETILNSGEWSVVNE